MELIRLHQIWGISRLTMHLKKAAKESASLTTAPTARLSTLTVMSSDNQGSSFRPLWLLLALTLAAARSAFCFSNTLSFSISCSILLFGRTVPAWASVGLHSAHDVRMPMQHMLLHSCVCCAGYQTQQPLLELTYTNWHPRWRAAQRYCDIACGI